MKMKFVRVIVFAVFLLSIGACSNQLSEGEQMPNPTTDEVGMPEYEQLPFLKEQAMAGSPQAAIKLSLWYMKFPNENDTDYFWTRIAAENGSAAGQFNLAHKLLSDPSNPLNKVRAKYWLSLSAKQGAQPAIEKLAELNAEKP